MYKRITVALLVAISFSLILAGSGVINGSSARAAGPHQTTDVIKIENGQPVGSVPGSWAKLVRSDNGVAVSIRTSELTAGDAVTVWGFVWKDPTACNGPCDGDDIGLAMVAHVAGNIVGGSGKSSFAGNLDVWSGSENPDDSEIHFGLVSHGPKVPGIVHEQLSTPTAGCGGPCPLVQGVVFLPVP